MTSLTSFPDPDGSIIGRARELELLIQHFQRAGGGQGNTVLLSGEAGIGKTHLVSRLREQARELGALVLAGHCYDLGTAPPYGPWQQLLTARQLAETFPTLPALFAELARGEPLQNQTTLFSEVFLLISRLASEQPLLLVLEDLHWSDTASLDLLRAVARQVSQSPILIVATYRNDEITRDHPLYRRIPALLREAWASRVDLQPLDFRATSELVQARFSLSDDDCQRLTHYLQDRAQGNPFFIGELLYSLEEEGLLLRDDAGWRLAPEATDSATHPVPELIQQVIDSRLDRLDPEVARMLEIAAVIGPEAPLDLWQTLSDVDDEALIHATRQAIEGQFLQESPDGPLLLFRHALVREALYKAVILPQRRLLHARCGEILAARAAPDPDRIANHFVQAHDVRAIDWLARSGELALKVYAPENAIEHFTQALEIAASLGIEPPAAISRMRGLAHSMVGNFSHAQADFTVALESARAAGDLLLQWQALIDLGALWSERDYARTRELYTEAHALACTIGDETTVAHSLNRAGNWHLNVDQPGEAIQRHEEALAMFQNMGDARGVAQTARMLGMSHLVRGDLVRSNVRFREAADRFDALDDRLGLCAALTGLIYTGGTYTFHTEIPGPLGPDELAGISERAIAIAVETRWRSGEAYIACALGSHHGIRGNYGEALDFTRRGLDIARQVGHREWMALAHQILGRLYLDLFAIPEAGEHLRQSLELARTAGAPIHTRLATSYLAYVHLANGELPRALGTLDQTLTSSRPGATVIERKCWATRASVALGSGDFELALEIADDLLRTTLNQNMGGVIPLYGRLRGEALTQLNRYDEAEEQLLAARNTAIASGYLPVVWRLNATLGRLYRAWDRPFDADEWFGRARSLVDDLAQSIPEEPLRGVFLSQAANRIPAPRFATPLQSAKHAYGGLTARQREVAALIAHGHSNADIATLLSISQRTAEGHVTAILTTLDFTSRAQIAAWAVDRGLVKL